MVSHMLNRVPQLPTLSSALMFFPSPFLRMGIVPVDPNNSHLESLL